VDQDDDKSGEEVRIVGGRKRKRGEGGDEG
jgi:hypothetical protein